MRLFVALQLPRPTAVALGGWAAEALADERALRLVALDALHVTLVFLGARSPRDVGPATAVVEEVVAGATWPTRLRARGAVWLSPRRPHVLAVGLEDPDGVLAALQAALAEGLHDALGLTPELRGFLPHVTVARVRRGQLPRSYDVPTAPPDAPFAPTSVALMRSELGPGGASYEALRTAAPGARRA